MEFLTHENQTPIEIHRYCGQKYCVSLGEKIEG
jgi:hypothetical protein